MASWDTEGILRIRCPEDTVRIPGHPHDLSMIGGRRRYPQDTAVSSGCHRYPEDTVSPGHHWYLLLRKPRFPQDTAVCSPGYGFTAAAARYPQDTVSQDTVVSWGHRILRTPPRVLGHGVPRNFTAPCPGDIPVSSGCPPCPTTPTCVFRRRFSASGSPIPRCHGSLSFNSEPHCKKNKPSPPPCLSRLSRPGGHGQRLARSVSCCIPMGCPREKLRE